MKIFLAIFFCCTVFAFSQNSNQQEARPKVGWDSLQRMVVYPEIARRAGVEDIARVKVEIAADGKVTNIEFAGYGIFSEAVKSVIRNTEWLPETDHNVAKASQVVFDVKFQLKDIKNFPKRRVLTIEADAPRSMDNR